MLIHIAGSDSFLAKRAIDQIKDKYIAKNPTGAELIEITPDSFLEASSPTSPRLRGVNWADLQAIPLFATSRLVVAKDATKFPAGEQENLAHFLTRLPETTVAVVWSGKPAKGQTALPEALKSAAKTISAEPLIGDGLARFVMGLAKELGIAIMPAILRDIIGSHGDNLWAIETELKRLQNDPSAHFENKQKTIDEPFAIFRFVRSNNWLGVKKQLRTDAELGKPIELIIGGLAAAVRKDVRDPLIKKAVTDLLMDVDIGLKTGLLDDQAAIAILITHLPKPLPERVNWEQVYDEIYEGSL